MSREPESDVPEYLPPLELLERERRIRRATRLAVIGGVGLLLAAGLAIAGIVAVI